MVCLLVLALFVILYLFKKSILKAVSILSVSALGIYILGNTVFADAWNNVLERFKAEDISTGRNILFKLYNDFIFSDIKNFLFGIGLHNVDTKTGIFNTPHNAIQEVVLCWGIIGLAVIVFLFGYMFRQYKKIVDKDKIIYIVPIFIFIMFIQTIQFVRLSSIFGLLVLLYVVILTGGINSEQKSVSDNG